MIILSHRGYWKTPPEKNQLTALERSLRSGFGLETDLRDYKGRLVVSHDIAGESSLSFATFLSTYRMVGHSLMLALNIKADGLQNELRRMVEEYAIRSYFLFDMSVPGMLACLNLNLRVFTRQSEYEPAPSLYSEAAGVWMDMFRDDWIEERHIAPHLQADKQVAIVSPELHGRPHLPFWKRLSSCSTLSNSEVMLCTDYPEQAMEFLNG